MRYAILGTGAVGGYYGALLASQGKDVHFVARSNREALQKHGLRLESENAPLHLTQLAVHDTPETVPPCDVILVALKTTQLDAARTYLPTIMAPGGVVVALQNGLGAEETLGQWVAAERIWGAICFLCATQDEPGVIVQKDTSKISLAPWLHQRPCAALENFVSSLRAAGARADLHEDLARLRWKKLVWNIPYNGLCALLRQNTSQINRFAETRALVEVLMDETRRACELVTGRRLDTDLAARLISMTDEFDGYEPSMLVDARRGRPLELDAIYFEPLARARAANFTMTATETLARLLRAQQTAQLKGS